MAYTDIDDPSAYFQTKLYTGTNNELVLTFDGNSDLQTDMIWTKNRSRASTNHVLSDTVRGIGKGLYPDLTNTEGDTNYVSAIGSDGYTIVATDSVEINRDDDTFVSWNWKEQAGVFDIVSYTGNGSNRTIAHNLGVVPKMMIVKRRNADSTSWFVYHVANGNGNVMKLDNTEAVSAYAEYWNATTPTSSVFSLGTAATANVDGGTFIAYLFGDSSISKMGSYTANANVNGTFVFTGHKPAFLLIKNTSQATDWIMYDNKRDGFEPQNKEFRANTSAAERNAEDNNVQFCANGFKLRNAGTKSNADSGNTLIYMSFAEQPFVTSTGNGSIPATAR